MLSHPPTRDSGMTTTGSVCPMGLAVNMSRYDQIGSKYLKASVTNGNQRKVTVTKVKKFPRHLRFSNPFKAIQSLRGRRSASNQTKKVSVHDLHPFAPVCSGLHQKITFPRYSAPLRLCVENSPLTLIRTKPRLSAPIRTKKVFSAVGTGTSGRGHSRSEPELPVAVNRVHFLHVLCLGVMVVYTLQLLTRDSAFENIWKSHLQSAAQKFLPSFARS